jgi:hypothetical protein
MNYWLDLFTWETWNEFKKAGGSVSGFREQRWRPVQQMQKGDVLLCYLTGISRWVGLLEVTGQGFRDVSPIWARNSFPARVPVKILAELTPETAVPVLDMRDQLSMFINAKSEYAWTGSFRGSPAKWSAADGKAVYDAVMQAVASPVVREYDPAKLQKIPPILRTAKLGNVTRQVTIPGDEEVESDLPEKQAPLPFPTLATGGHDSYATIEQ